MTQPCATTVAVIPARLVAGEARDAREPGAITLEPVQWSRLALTALRATRWPG